MKRLAHAKKRDTNEPEIVAALRAIGATVFLLDNPVDLLVGKNGKTYLIEVKNENGTLTKDEEKFIKLWQGNPVKIVKTIDEAIEIILND